MKARSKSPQRFFNDVNFIIKLLILSDVLVVGSAAMLAPLFALFVEDYIIGGDALVASVAMGLFLVARSLLQIPIATIIDRVKGEQDDYVLLTIFSVISSLLLLLYLFIRHPWQLYGVQLLIGTATAITYPSYMAIFTRHVDKNKEGTEWGIYYTMTDLGSAFLAVVGGHLAVTYGFHRLIIVCSLVSLIGSLLIIPIKPLLYKTNKK